MIVEAGECGPEVLRRFYTDVLRPSFREAELVTLDELLHTYDGPTAGPGALLLDAGRPVAGVLAEFLGGPRGTLLIGYLAVHPDQRGRGAGILLLTESLARWAVRFPEHLVVAEVDDPRFHSPDALTGDPAGRLRFYGRCGARLLAMPFVQPALRPGQPRVPDMLLICFSQAPAVPTETVREFLHEYFIGCEGAGVVDEPQFQSLLAVTAQAPEIQLWPLERYPDVPRLTG